MTIKYPFVFIKSGYELVKMKEPVIRCRKKGWKAFDWWLVFLRLSCMFGNKYTTGFNAGIVLWRALWGEDFENYRRLGENCFTINQRAIFIWIRATGLRHEWRRCVASLKLTFGSVIVVRLSGLRGQCSVIVIVCLLFVLNFRWVYTLSCWNQNKRCNLIICKVMPVPSLALQEVRSLSMNF